MEWFAFRRADVRAGWVGAVVVWAGALFGCAHDNAADRQMAKLREEVARVQSERDQVEERLRQLEVKTSVAEASADAVVPSSSSALTPALHMVRLAPGEGVEPHQASETAGSRSVGALAEDEPIDVPPRPAIRVIGSRTQLRAGGMASRSASPDADLDDEEEFARSMDAPRAPEVLSSALDPAARRAYDQALKGFRAQKYDQSLDAFAAFILGWPDHPYVGSAMYWRGECYFAKGDYPLAAEQFDGVLARFPRSNKVADCHLKLGLCHQKLGHPEKATWYFEQLAQKFPQSEAARRIPREEKP